MQLERQDKIIAVTLLLHSIAGLRFIWAIWVYRIPDAAFLLSNALLVAIGFGAALGWFKRWTWGLFAGVLFYAVQIPHIQSPDLTWSFTLGFQLIFMMGWGSTHLGFNFLAFAMLVWMWWRGRARNGCRVPDVVPQDGLALAIEREAGKGQEGVR